MKIKKCIYLKFLLFLATQISLVFSNFSSVYANDIHWMVSGTLKTDSIKITNKLFVHNGTFLDDIYPSYSKSASMTIKNQEDLSLTVKMFLTENELVQPTPKELAPQHAPGATPPPSKWPHPTPTLLRNNPAHLLDVMWLEFTNSSKQVIFSGWITDLIGEDNAIDLPNLAANAKEVYTFSITMWDDAGNIYQSLKADFDVNLYLYAIHPTPTEIITPTNPVTPQTPSPAVPNVTQTITPSPTNPDITQTITPYPTNSDTAPTSSPIPTQIPQDNTPTPVVSTVPPSNTSSPGGYTPNRPSTPTNDPGNTIEVPTSMPTPVPFPTSSIATESPTKPPLPTTVPPLENITPTPTDKPIIDMPQTGEPSLTLNLFGGLFLAISGVYLIQLSNKKQKIIV